MGTHRSPARRSQCARAALLAPHEARAPTANLSPTKLAALLACVKGDGTLHKCMGVWKSPAAQAGGRPIFGVTVADLARDGMVTVTVHWQARHRSAYPARQLVRAHRRHRAGVGAGFKSALSPQPRSNPMAGYLGRVSSQISVKASNRLRLLDEVTLA